MCEDESDARAQVMESNGLILYRVAGHTLFGCNFFPNSRQAPPFLYSAVQYVEKIVKGICFENDQKIMTDKVN